MFTTQLPAVTVVDSLLAKCQSKHTLSLRLTFRNRKLSYCRVSTHRQSCAV